MTTLIIFEEDDKDLEAGITSYERTTMIGTCCNTPVEAAEVGGKIF